MSRLATPARRALIQGVSRVLKSFRSVGRTAIGTFGGSLKEMPAVDLGAAAIRAAVARAGLRPHG
jgi:hypothetical protein